MLVYTVGACLPLPHIGVKDVVRWIEKNNNNKDRVMSLTKGKGEWENGEVRRGR